MLYLQRTEEPLWEASINLMEESYVMFAGRFTEDTYARCFAMFDRVVEAVRPDFASVGRAHFPPTKDADSIDQSKLSYCCGVAPVNYTEYGPHGLGERTYVGSHYISQLGLPRIRSLSIPIREGGLDGLYVDLTSEVANSPRAEMLDPWRSAMEALEPARVFAKVRVFKNGSLAWTMGENCDLGDLARPPTEDNA